MLGNRDTQRVNKANKAIQACLLGKINNETFDHIQKGFPNASSICSSKLIELAKNSNEKMIHNFCLSQESISKAGCERYASTQHNLITNAFRNKEDVNAVGSISQHIVDKDLLEVYSNLSTIITNETNEDIDQCNQIDTTPNSEDIDTIQMLSSELNVYCMRNKIPRLHKRYNTPYSIAKFLATHRPYTFENVRISRLSLIKHLIHYHYVPCKRTTCYKLLKLYRQKQISESVTWTELEKDGRKPYLSNQGLQDLISDIKNSTDGGTY